MRRHWVAPTWLIVLLLVAAPPLAAVLVWLFTRWPTWLKIAASLWAALVLVTWMPGGAGLPLPRGQGRPAEQAPTPTPAAQRVIQLAPVLAPSSTAE